MKKENYGVWIRFDGYISLPEMTQFCEEYKKLRGQCAKTSGTLSDLRDAKPFPQDVQSLVVELEEWANSRFSGRDALVVASTVMAVQLERLAKESGRYEFQRAIDASKVENWEQVARDWVVDGVDPDKA